MRVRFAKTAAAGVALVLGCSCVGCGGGGARGEVRLVSARFVRALAADDGVAACATLSRQARAHLENEEAKSCGQAITGLGLRPSAVRRVQVYLTSAKADLADGDSVFLSNGSDGWRLDAAGCKPEGGKPADRPYDCALET
jgi:hypothetical protein